MKTAANGSAPGHKRHRLRMRRLFLFVGLLLATALPAGAGTVVFYEPNFPTAENGIVSRAVLERALAPLHPRFVTLAELQLSGTLADGDLLLLPYGSAFPVDAWPVIQQQLQRGNVLVLGGRPFYLPVRRDSSGWHRGQPRSSYARFAGIDHASEVPQRGPWKLQWDEDAPWFRREEINARRVFANTVVEGRYRGIGFFIDSRGNRLAAPVAVNDLVGRAQPPRRRLYLSFDADSGYWSSQSGVRLLQHAALYAARGGTRIWLDLQQLTLDPGDRVAGAVDVVQASPDARLTIEILSDDNVVASRSTPCGPTLHQEIGLAHRLNGRGLYRVRATLSSGDSLFDRYTSGVVVRDPSLLRSGGRLGTGRDFFRLDARPYLMVGANYFSTDLHRASFFVGGSIGGNAWRWEEDFAEIERQGLTAVRTGIWLNRARYLDPVSGAADERLLRAIEAYLSVAARHHMQVIFTFFAFNPQTLMQQGPGQTGDLIGPGSNPYIDPAAIEHQLAYVRAIASRFREVPFLSFDLINEPSFSNPKRLWKGNSPNGDTIELAAWQHWLRERYTTIDSLAEAWQVPAAELGAFERVPLPSFEDLELVRTGRPWAIRAVDYNLFAQDAFRQWTDAIIRGIRDAGAQQLITVGQDEGGVTDRVLNQFWTRSAVDYTVDHTWWRDDALLWNSVVSKTPGKPNLIGETGPQPVVSVDGTSRWYDQLGMPLVERKLVLGFANATAGVLHWDWSRDGVFGLLRRDGSQMQWMEPLRGIAAFARDAQAYATDVRLPEIALVLPQSLQLSVFGSWSLAVQQNAVRALFYHARATAFAVGEYQLSTMPPAKLIIVPAPWVLHQAAWDTLMAKAAAGATLLLSGRIDADEHWSPRPERLQDWNREYSWGALTTREAEVRWPEGSARLSYSLDRTTYGERGFLKDDETFAEIRHGAGRILYSPLPLELADQISAIAQVYKYAIKRAGVQPVYETSVDDPGILICPTQLPDATLYVLVSESTSNNPVKFRDVLSGAEFSIPLVPGRAALLLVGRNGRLLASYNMR